MTWPVVLEGEGVMEGRGEQGFGLVMCVGTRDTEIDNVLNSSYKLLIF